MLVFARARGNGGILEATTLIEALFETTWDNYYDHLGKSW